MLTRALADRFTALGGEIRCGERVDRVLRRRRPRDGRAHRARRHGRRSGTPWSRTWWPPTCTAAWSGPRTSRAGRGPRCGASTSTPAPSRSTGRSSGPVPWSEPPSTLPGHRARRRLARDRSRRRSAQVAAGIVPAEPFLLAGQMTTTDPTRSPAGTESMWAYTHVPQQVLRDAGEEGIRGRLGPRRQRAVRRPGAAPDRAPRARVRVAHPGPSGARAPRARSARRQPGRRRHQRRHLAAPPAAGVPARARSRPGRDPGPGTVPGLGLGAPGWRRARRLRRQRGPRRPRPSSPQVRPVTARLITTRDVVIGRVVLVLHGGAARPGQAMVSPAQLSVLRMIPVARRIARAGRGRSAVHRLLNSSRGWETSHTPVMDAAWALGELRERYGERPVALVGHSLGGRAALLAGDQPDVRAVVALNPWLYGDESVDLRGRVPCPRRPRRPGPHRAGPTLRGRGPAAATTGSRRPHRRPRWQARDAQARTHLRAVRRRAGHLGAARPGAALTGAPCGPGRGAGRRGRAESLRPRGPGRPVGPRPAGPPRRRGGRAVRAGWRSRSGRR